MRPVGRPQVRRPQDRRPQDRRPQDLLWKARDPLFRKANEQKETERTETQSRAADRLINRKEREEREEDQYPRTRLRGRPRLRRRLRRGESRSLLRSVHDDHSLCLGLLSFGPSAFEFEPRYLGCYGSDTRSHVFTI